MFVCDEWKHIWFAECDCILEHSDDTYCDVSDGHCKCKFSYDGKTCNECHKRFSGYPNCRGISQIYR